VSIFVEFEGTQREKKIVGFALELVRSRRRAFAAWRRVGFLIFKKQQHYKSQA